MSDTIRNLEADFAESKIAYQEGLAALTPLYARYLQLEVFANLAKATLPSEINHLLEVLLTEKLKFTAYEKLGGKVTMNVLEKMVIRPGSGTYTNSGNDAGIAQICVQKDPPNIYFNMMVVPSWPVSRRENISNSRETNVLIDSVLTHPHFEEAAKELRAIVTSWANILKGEQTRNFRSTDPVSVADDSYVAFSFSVASYEDFFAALDKAIKPDYLLSQIVRPATCQAI